jgi:hypothetical protein
MDAVTIRNEILRWVAAIAGCLALAVVIYLGAVFSVYLLGWIVQLIGIIFT